MTNIKDDELIIKKLEKELSKSSEIEKILLFHKLSDINNSIEKKLYYLEHALQLARELENNKLVSDTLIMLSSVYIDLSNYDKAFEQLYSSLNIKEDINDTKGISCCFRNIGIIYANLNNYEKSLEYFLKSLDIEKQCKQELNVAGLYNNIGIVYKELKDYKKALEYHEKSLEIRRKYNLKKPIASSINNIGVVHYLSGNLDVALEYLQRSLILKKESGDVQGIANTYLNIGNLYIKWEKYEKAILSLDKGLELSKKISAQKLVKDIYYAYFKLYYEQNNYKKALEYHILLSEISAQIFNEKSQQKIAKIQILYETEKKEKESEIYRLKNIELKKANATKDKFFSIIAHDLKSPFAIIISFVHLMKMNYDKYSPEKVKELINELEISAKNTYSLLENLLNWSRIQSSSMKFFPQKIRISSLIDHIFELSIYRAKEKEINLINQVGEDIEVYADNFMLETIIRNLVNNAIKFTESGGSIIISCQKKDKMVEFSVQDTGIGMNKKSIDKLFKIETSFSTFGTRNEKGTGLGLILCKEFIEQNKGRISVESEIGKGTRFYFLVPQFIETAT